LPPEAAVAGSRILRDRGRMDDNSHVGVSGASVTQALQMVCCVSDVSRHVVGMKGAKRVTVIHRDPRAPFSTGRISEL